MHTHPELGDILVGVEGRALYMFDDDMQDGGASACWDACAETWPPYIFERTLTVGSDVDAEVTTFERSYGPKQVTANGWPLYRYSGDQEPGDATGQGVGDVWWTLDAAGEPIRPQETSTPTPTQSGEADYEY